ncbi:MAG: DUF1826 domain-containing protein [Rhodobacterales bacterium]|nr:DUF1826 domain-containing protein [Rhodobacterales bacterium]
MTGPLASHDGARADASTVSGAGIETCDAMDGLGAIGHPGVELVIWRRALPGRLRTWLDHMDASRLPDLRVLVRPADLRRAVEPYLVGCGMPPGDLRDLLLGDIGELVSTFARVARTDLVDVRLEPVDNDACWKFHRDCVEARLLTTYRGPATEWVQPIHAARALDEQRAYEGPLERLGAHDVAVFKGSCAGPGSGIVHRSPPIVGTRQTRLLLVLNKQTMTSPVCWSPTQPRA